MTDIQKIVIGSAKRSNCIRPRKQKMQDGTRVFVTCKSHQMSYCPSCAKAYANDQKRLIGSGCNPSERDSITEAKIAPYSFYFVTLTAPSFGAVHRVAKTKTSKLVPCKCGKIHEYGDELRGTPLNSRWYKYREQVEWNVASSELFRRTIMYTEDLLPDLEWSFAREWQTRGALHLHGIIRVPATYDEGETWVALQKMRTYKLGKFAWGSEFDVKGIKGDASNGSVRYMAKVVSYTAKQQGDAGLISEARQKHYDRLDWHAARIRCVRTDCLSNGTCIGKRHKTFGYSGRMVTYSKNWSFVALTQTRLIEERKAFAQSNTTDLQQRTLVLLAEVIEKERREEMKHLHTRKIHRQMQRNLMNSFYGETAGESVSYRRDEIKRN